MRFPNVLMAWLMWIPGALASDIGAIEFFGSLGLDVARIRQALPIREGEEYSDALKDRIRHAVAQSTGQPPTDVAAICCDPKGNRLIFIGLAGGSFRRFAYAPAPRGSERLPAAILSLYERLDREFEAAVNRGGSGLEEDDSHGYALMKDPSVRALQLQVRNWALQHEPELRAVLERSSAAVHRRVASDALGYARKSERQILALVHAARDPDEEVRNNATRALGVLVRSDPKLAVTIVPDTFIEMLSSGIWTDRNKAAALLDGLTFSRRPELLAKIRASALESLIEMAQWRGASHASFARRVLGRIAGLPEKRLDNLAWDGPVEEIVQAARKR